MRLNLCQISFHSPILLPAMSSRMLSGHPVIVCDSSGWVEFFC